LDLYAGALDLGQVVDSPNAAFTQNDDGGFSLIDDEDNRPLESSGTTLAIGAVDVDHDGLEDILIANDSFAVRGQRGRGDAGKVLFRCGPADDCVWDERTFDRGVFAFGSYMGVANVNVRGHGEFTYLSDLGPNRFVQWEGRSPQDLAPEFGVDLGGAELFKWAVVVDDFDRNGLDDIYVSYGDLVPDSPATAREHVDRILMQRGDGDFTVWGPEETGLSPPTRADARSDRLFYMARGAAKADLDHDGYLDLVTAGLTGGLRFYRETQTPDNAPDRCTLVPRPRYAPAQGHGYAFARVGTEDFRRWDIQGQIRTGASAHILVPMQRGVLRFPSGYRASFDCDGQPGPLLVEEPEWVFLSPRRTSLQVVIEAPWIAPGSALGFAVRDHRGAVRERAGVNVDNGRWTTTLAADEVAVMLSLDGVWIPRWFSLE
jgi:hypothetical protein